jgi:hypothetical protein
MKGLLRMSVASSIASSHVQPITRHEVPETLSLHNTA